jgi:precorrin-4/cobalt-precorrin-4 C11-methyltransferase
LIPHYGADGAVAVVVRASWPEQVIIRGTLSTIAAQVRAAAIERTALILVGPALCARDFADSALYSADYDRRFRPSAETGRVRK